MYHYICYIKSHCEAPDFEFECDAENFNEACEKFKMEDWSAEDLIDHVACMDDIDKECSACSEYQNLQVAKGCPIHEWQPKKKYETDKPF